LSFGCRIDASGKVTAKACEEAVPNHKIDQEQKQGIKDIQVGL
jgi:hypothetical protein